MSKSSLTLLCVSASLLALTACGGGAQTSTSETSSRTEYSFEYNGCDTGVQTADTALGNCRNLTNDKLNHHCADWMRKDAFDKARCTSLGVKWDDSSNDDDDAKQVTDSN
jgi:hypothetical protein